MMETPPPRDTPSSILLVDDEPAVRSLARRVLQRAGFEVIEAECGDEALRRFAERPSAFDLLLTDVMMPGMSGRELAARLLERNPRLRVLFMSGYPDDKMGAHGVLDAGLHFLEKPFTPDGLVRQVTRVLRRPV